MSQRLQSTVTSWLVTGFGFIRNPNPGGDDLYVHASDVPFRPSRGKTLRPGEKVEFEIARTPRGLKAVNVAFPNPLRQLLDLKPETSTSLS